MYNAYAMSATLEAKKHSQQASMITAGFAGLMILIMFLLRWEMPALEKNIESPGIEVELNLPEEPEIPAKGGGGGGNPVHAAGPAGVASYSPPQPGVKEDSKDIEEDNDKNSPAITKPDIVKPTATKINNTSVVKTTPKPVIETPAPRIPKAVAGKTLTGAGKGGGTDDYQKSGGSGNGSGVGNGNGTGGGTGNGNGGGNGTGNGGGNGPKVVDGERRIVRSYSFEGDLDKATIFANVNVSPDGTGKFMSIAKGSSSNSNAYKEAVMRYLQNIKFDKSDHESMVTVKFNFTVN